MRKPDHAYINTSNVKYTKTHNDLTNLRKLEKTSKAAILKELLDAQDARFANRPIPGTHGVRAVYADDDVHELCEEGVAALARAGRVVRVLFAPGGVG